MAEILYPDELVVAMAAGDRPVVTEASYGGPDAISLRPDVVLGLELVFANADALRRWAVALVEAVDMQPFADTPEGVL